LYYDARTGSVQLIDHGSAFYDWKYGRQYFTESKHSLVINQSNHCIAEQIRSLDDFDEWHSRVKAIPEYFIRESMLQSASLGLPINDVDFCVEFLLDRRDRLKDLFRFNLNCFPKLQRHLFEPFAGPQELEFYI
jgi:hypothetical protein